MKKLTLIAGLGRPAYYTDDKGRKHKEVLVYAGCFIFDPSQKIKDDDPYFKGAFFLKSRKGLLLQGETTLTKNASTKRWKHGQKFFKGGGYDF